MSDMGPRPERLVLALAAFAVFRSPGRIRAAIGAGRLESLLRHELVTQALRQELAAEADQLADVGVDVIAIGDDEYPIRLVQVKAAPPLLFCWGNKALLQSSAVGMCGSRNVSEKGLEAARTCGLEVARHGLIVVSGYAKGVDTVTHHAALEAGGNTVIVLAEGIRGFRRKRVFSDVPFDQHHVLVVSQFPPGQRWNVGAAMTRNTLIAGVGQALVVIEAGETGGTLNAGLQALEMSKPVLALEFSSQETPPGNQTLISKGAIAIRGRLHLGKVLEVVQGANGSEPLDAQQLSLLT
jgi:DNA processing protein